MGGWTSGALVGASAGGIDHFVMKVNSVGQTQWTVQRGSAQAKSFSCLHFLARMMCFTGCTPMRQQ